jgi:hypothetical protein
MHFDTVVVEVPEEIVVYETRWRALIDCMVEGLPLHEELQGLLDAHQRERPRVDEPASKPEDRIAQIRAKVEALVNRYGDVLRKTTVWFAHLQEHLQICQAHLDNLPLAASISGVHDAMSRALRDRMPEKPKVKDLEDPDSLEARARYIRTVRDVIEQSEGYPRLVANAIAALHETFKTFAREMDEARFKGQRSNCSAFRYQIPQHPLVGYVGAAPKAATPVSDYEWLGR